MSVAVADDGSYSYTATATDMVGNVSAASPARAVTVLSPPSAPTAVSATAGNGRAAVAFGPSASDGGGPLVYTVTASPGGRAATGSASPLVVTGLANGTAYAFTVTASNLAATGPASSATSPVVPDSGAEDRAFPFAPPEGLPRPAVPVPPAGTGVRSPPPPR
jgi:hypothetical protein